MQIKRTFQENITNYRSYAIQMDNAHYFMAEHYKKRHRYFGISVVILSSIVGTSVFSTLAKTQDYPIIIVTGFLSVLAVVMAALQTFLGYADLQVQHKNSAVGYSMARRKLELLIMEYPNTTGQSDEPGTKILEDIVKQLDDLDRASPTIPDKYYEKVKRSRMASNVA